MGYEVVVTTAEGAWSSLDKTVDGACENIARRIEIERVTGKGQTSIW